MNKANPGNDQTKGRSRRIRREKGSRKCHSDSDCSKATRSPGISFGSESQRTNRTNCQGVTRFLSTGKSVGGTLRQLIVNADNQLAKISSRIQQLDTERQNLEREWEEARQEKEQLQALLDNLQQSIQENP